MVLACGLGRRAGDGALAQPPGACAGRFPHPLPSLKVGGAVGDGPLDQRHGDLGSHLRCAGIRGCDGLLLLVGLGSVRVALPDERGDGPPPLLGLLVGVLDPLRQASALRVHQAHRPVRRESGDGFARDLGRGGESPVGAIALERGGELLPCVVQVRGDGMELVGVLAAGHAYVYAGRVERVGQDCVRAGHGRALDAVGGRGVGQVGVLRDVLGRQAYGALPLLAGRVLLRPHGPVRSDLLHGPGLPVRHLHVAVVVPGLDHIASTDRQAVAPGGGAGIVDHADTHALVSDARVQLARFVVGRHGDRVPVVRVAGDCVLLDASAL